MSGGVGADNAASLLAQRGLLFCFSPIDDLSWIGFGLAVMMRNELVAGIDDLGEDFHPFPVIECQRQGLALASLDFGDRFTQNKLNSIRLHPQFGMRWDGDKVF